MEDISAIHRILKNLKYEMENNGWVYQWHLGDEPIKVTHKFNPPVTPEEFQLFEKYFPNMKLPASWNDMLLHHISFIFDCSIFQIILFV